MKNKKRGTASKPPKRNYNINMSEEMTEKLDAIALRIGENSRAVVVRMLLAKAIKEDEQEQAGKAPNVRSSSSSTIASAITVESGGAQNYEQESQPNKQDRIS